MSAAYRVVCVRKSNGFAPGDDGRTVVYVGRKVRFLDWTPHPLSNPFHVAAGATDEERAECIAKYRAWLTARPDLREQLDALREATRGGELPLGCWCSPKACHADVLAELLNALPRGEGGT